jgi:hypothetical protein
MKPFPWEPEPVKFEKKKKRRKHADEGSSDGYNEETGKDSGAGSPLDNGEGPSDWWRMSIPKDNDKQSSLGDGEPLSGWWKMGFSLGDGDEIYDEKYRRHQDRVEKRYERKGKEKKWHFKHLWRRMTDHPLLPSDKGKYNPQRS